METVPQKQQPETDYSAEQYPRFRYTLTQILRTLPPPKKIADIGCHRLDQTIMFKEAGYDIQGFDIPEFINKPSVQEKSGKYSIPLYEIYDLERAKFSAPVGENFFDAVIFAEILEHIAFNPILMWKGLFRLLKPGGYLFITTPNSLDLKNTLKGLINILSRKGRGIPVTQILTNVTYGHHWKEYSKQEIFEYFEHLGVQRNNVQVKYVEYGQPNGEPIIQRIRRLAVDCFPALKSDLFVMVKMDGVKPQIPDAPQYLG